MADARRSSLPASHAVHMPGTQAGDRRVPALTGAVRESPSPGCRVLKECKSSADKTMAVQRWVSSLNHPALLRRAIASYQESLVCMAVTGLYSTGCPKQLWMVLFPGHGCPQMNTHRYSDGTSPLGATRHSSLRKPLRATCKAGT